MTIADEETRFSGFAGRVHETRFNADFRPASSASKPDDNPGNAGCLKTPRFRRLQQQAGRFAA